MVCQARGSQVLCRFGAGPHISLCLLQVADEAWAAEQRSLHQLQQLQEERDAGKARLEQVEAQLRQVRWRLGTSNAGLPRADLSSNQWGVKTLLDTTCSMQGYPKQTCETLGACQPAAAPP